MKSVFFFFLVLGLSFAQSLARGTQHLDLPDGAIGPETIAFDCRGRGPYVGVSDGRILRWEGSNVGWMEFATTVSTRNPSCNGLRIDTGYEVACGRPLGLKFHPRMCELYIADAYSGLMKVDRHGGVATQLVASVDGIPLRFTNDLEIDHTSGVVYFTDTSMIYPRWQWQRVIGTADRTGRLIRYDPRDNSVSVLLGGLAFPNGVTLSKDREFLLVAETTTGVIRRYWLSGPKRHTNEIFAQLGGRPDNINRDANGDFWIAQNPTLPIPMLLRSQDRGRPVKMDSSGRILEVLTDAGSTSDVSEHNRRIYLGSVEKRYVEIRS